MFLLVDFEHLGCKVCSVAVAKFLDGVNSGSLQKLRELRANSLDTEEVCVIYPCENAAMVDACSLLKSSASLCRRTLLKKLVYGFNSCSNKFLCIDGADALDVDNLVGHNQLCVKC